MLLDDFLSRLDKVKKVGGGNFTCLCPAHNDSKPSLSVKAVSGKIILKCWVGCSAEKIVLAMGLEMSDLFETPLDPKKPIPQEVKDKRRLEQTVKKASIEQPEGNVQHELLGSIILNNDLIHDAEAELDVNHFSLRESKIFAAMQELSHENLDITPALLAERSGEKLSWITNLTYQLIPARKIDSYIKALKDKFEAKQLLQLGHYIEDAFEDGLDKDEILANVETRLDALRENEAGGFRPFIDVASDAFQHLQDLRDDKTVAYSTGLPSLDKLLRGGGYPGELHVIVAKTSKGKSSLAKQIAHFMAVHKLPVGFVTAEMTDKAVLFRILSPEAGVANWAIQPGIAHEKLDALEQALVKIDNLPIWIDAHTTNIFELRARAKALKRSKGIKVLFVDYLQLLSVREEKSFSRMSRTEEVAFVSRLLKKLAKELDIWVIALAQFNRSANQKREDGSDVELEIHQIAESGAIEKDADVVWILDMEPYVKGQPERKASLKIGKNRESISDITLVLIFNGNYLLFREEGQPLILNEQPKPLEISSNKLDF
jgi:replicative DNA helicase